VNSTLKNPSLSAETAPATLVPKLMMWKRKELMMDWWWKEKPIYISRTR